MKLTLVCAKSCCTRQTYGMSFFDRNRREMIAKGYDPARLPPGQYRVEDFPVLHVGPVPEYAPGQWDLAITGLVKNPMRITWDDLIALPSIEMTVDIHCVTKWSQFDMKWKGVKVSDVFASAGLESNATHVMAHAEYGYTANLPLADATTDQAIIAYAYDDVPIEPIHGGPVRLVVPHLYFWKSPKWLRALELMDHDAPGFWERNGYHMYGDPFKEQRHWGD